MVLRYCLGMIMSVSTLIIFSGAATPSSVVNLSMSFIRTLELFCFMPQAGVLSSAGVPCRKARGEKMPVRQTLGAAFIAFVALWAHPAKGRDLVHPRRRQPAPRCLRLPLRARLWKRRAPQSVRRHLRAPAAGIERSG